MKMIESFEGIETIELIQQAQRDIDDLLRNLASDKVKQVQDEIDYSNNNIESHHVQDYLTILRLKKFVNLTIADKVSY